MSEIAEIIDSLENRIEKLFLKIESLEKNSIGLKVELENAMAVIQKQSNEIVSLKSENESLKMTNSLLGGEENKRDTKLKINSLIREIDYCIAQLSD
jgi:predicted  nucleic acid-binding Zn-ribbon protein